MRYGFRLRDLGLYRAAEFETEEDAWPDLLVRQLVAEVEELLARGPHRAYLRRAEDLASPRGRIDIDALARRGQAAAAVLPCIHYVRHEDTLENRVLLAGLGLGARLAADPDLSVRARRLAGWLAETVRPAPLDDATFTALERVRSRLTAAYDPALELVRLLADAHGLALDGEDEPGRRLRLPGLLFDMNRLFQAVMTRFLDENLPDCRVVGEHRLNAVFRFDRDRNPRGRQPPTPRPDIVVFEGRRLAAMLDVKYRDLWELPLPPSMLYQLSIYALSHDRREATIVYPTLATFAREAAIEILDPVSRSPRGIVALRPCPLDALVAAIARPRGMATDLARRLAFGAPGVTRQDTP